MKKFIILFLVCILLSGCSIRKTDELTNSQKFNNEYAVGENNPFKYISMVDLEELFEEGSGLLFFGNSDCEWCIKSATILNKLLIKNEIEEILYFNPMILSDNDKEELLYIINEEIEDIEIINISVPCLYVIKDGVIIDYCDTNLEDYNNEEEAVNKLEKEYKKLIELYKES